MCKTTDHPEYLVVGCFYMHRVYSPYNSVYFASR